MISIPGSKTEYTGTHLGFSTPEQGGKAQAEKLEWNSTRGRFTNSTSFW